MATGLHSHARTSVPFHFTSSSNSGANLVVVLEHCPGWKVSVIVFFPVTPTVAFHHYFLPKIYLYFGKAHNSEICGLNFA